MKASPSSVLSYIRIPQSVAEVHLLLGELRGECGQKARERAERRAALDVEAVRARDAEREARPKRRARAFRLELLVAALERAPKAVQVVRVGVVVDELRLPLRLRGGLRVGRRADAENGRAHA